MIKFYIIYKQGDSTSESFAKECQESANRFSIETELFPGIYENIDEIMKEENLFVNPLGKHLFKNKGVYGCFLSHYKLWKHCVSLNEKIGVLEHDALIQKKIPEDMILKFKDYLNLDICRHFFKNSKWEEYSSCISSNRTDQLSKIKEFNSPKVGGSYYNEKIKGTFKEIKRSYINGTHAYLISSSGSKKMIDYAKKFGFFPADIHANSNFINLEYSANSYACVNSKMWIDQFHLSHVTNHE